MVSEKVVKPLNTREKISPEEIDRAVKKITASDGFVRSERVKRLLEYVVSKTLSGQSGALKAYSIGLDVFGIGPDADPEKMAVVRVEMGRLRKKLELYYHTVGADDPIRIDIPKGNYRPLFVSNKPEPVIGKKSQWKFISACVFVSLLALLVVGFLLLRPDKQTQKALAPRPPIVEVSLFKNYSGLKKMDHMAAGLSFDIVSELARFSWLAVYVARNEKTPASMYKKKNGAESPVVADYILSGSVNITNDRIIVAYRLVETRNQTVKWSKTFARALTMEDIYAIQHETATAIAVEVGRPEGIVKRLEQVRYRQQSPDLNSYVCTLMVYRYWRTFSDADHLRTRRCLEAAIRRDPDYAESQAAISFIYLDEVRYEKNRRKGYDPLKRSLAAAERAVKLDPFSTLAKQALFTAKLVAGDYKGFEQIGRQAIGLAPNNPELLADYGGKLALFVGKWDKGLKYARLALTLNSDPAPWYYVSVGYKAVMDEDYGMVLEWARKMNAPKWFHYHVLRVIGFAGLKDKQNLRSAIKDFRKIGVRSPVDAARRIDSWGGNEALRKVLKLRIRQAYQFAEGES